MRYLKTCNDYEQKKTTTFTDTSREWTQIDQQKKIIGAGKTLISVKELH